MTLLVIVGTVAQGTVYPPDGWCIPNTLVEHAYSAKYSDVCTIGNEIHVIWLDTRDEYSRVYYKKSTNDGYDWSEETPISAVDEIVPDEPRNISIVGNGDYIYVVYPTVDTLSGIYSLCFICSSNKGSTWGDEQEIETGLTIIPGAAMTIAEDSLRLVFCEEPNLVYTATGDHGSNWSSFNDIYIYDGEDPLSLREPDITTYEHSPHISCRDIGCAYIHIQRSSGLWQINGFYGYGNQNFCHSRISVAPDDGTICILLEKRTHNYNNSPPTYDTNIMLWYSTDGGSNWTTENLTGTAHGIDPDLIRDLNGRLIAVYGDWYNGDILALESTDNGLTWSEPNQLLNTDNGSPKPDPHTCIAQGILSRHLVFTTGYENAEQLSYTANDDTLLSDMTDATAFNCGRHLVREVSSDRLHAVYTSQGWIHYTVSGDEGATWAPYHIIEDLASQEKEQGYHPVVGLIPGYLWTNPCVVYECDDEIKYRYQDASVLWQGFTVLSDVTGLTPGQPAVATYDDQVYILFSVKNWVPNQQYVSAIVFYQFTYDDNQPPSPVILDEANNDALYDCKVSIAVDGDGNPHCVWEKKSGTNGNEEVYYSWFDGSDWSTPYDVSSQANSRSITPNIDCYGEYLSIVWCKVDESEIWGRSKNIATEIWSNGTQYSTEYAVTEYPVNAANDFSVWLEESDDQNDIRYRSDTYGSGWVSQSSENEYFCHSQLQRDAGPWDLYTLFTRGDDSPYRIILVHQQFGGGGGERSEYYTVETGLTSPSPFCLHRDSTINYGNYQIDYGRSSLTYRLSLLDPSFPYHGIKGKAYFSGGADKIHELWINGVKKAAIKVKPNQAYDFETLVPRELYRNEHRITLEIKSPTNTGVYLSGLKIYRIAKEGNIGGVQSLTDETYGSMRLSLSPNPFIDKLLIKPIQSVNTKTVYIITIYDASGRLVKTLNQDKNQVQALRSIEWDGRDESGHAIPAGIYFTQLKSGCKILTEKVIKLQ